MSVTQEHLRVRWSADSVQYFCGDSRKAVSSTPCVLAPVLLVLGVLCVRGFDEGVQYLFGFIPLEAESPVTVPDPSEDSLLVFQVPTLQGSCLGIG